MRSATPTPSTSKETSKPQQQFVEEEIEEITEESSSGSGYSFSIGNYAKRFVYCLARNLYTIKKIALFLAFVINLMLLFYKVTSMIPEQESDEINGSGSGSGSSEESGEDDDENVIEFLQMEEGW